MHMPDDTTLAQFLAGGNVTLHGALERSVVIRWVLCQ